MSIPGRIYCLLWLRQEVMKIKYPINIHGIQNSHRVRIVWLAVALLSIGLFIISIPQHAQHLHVVCSNALCGGSENATQLARELHSLSLTLDFYAAYSLSLQVIFALGYFTIAMIIFWRKSDDWMSLLVSLFLITFLLAYTDVPHELSRSSAFLGLLVACIGFIGEMTFPLRSEEHTSELQSPYDLVCRLLLEKKKKKKINKQLQKKKKKKKL